MQDRYRIPTRFSMLWVEEDDSFLLPDRATVADWRKAKRTFARGIEAGAYRLDSLQTIKQMVKIADAFGLPDDVVLLPRLQALAKDNVVVLRP
jgi:hypothetical protein